VIIVTTPAASSRKLIRIRKRKLNLDTPVILAAKKEAAGRQGLVERYAYSDQAFEYWCNRKDRFPEDWEVILP
jgi:hypothetical protein